MLLDGLYLMWQLFVFVILTGISIIDIVLEHYSNSDSVLLLWSTSQVITVF